MHEYRIYLQKDVIFICDLNYKEVNNSDTRSLPSKEKNASSGKRGKKIRHHEMLNLNLLIHGNKAVFARLYFSYFTAFCEQILEFLLSLKDSFWEFPFLCLDLLRSKIVHNANCQLPLWLFGGRKTVGNCFPGNLAPFRFAPWPYVS